MVRSRLRFGAGVCVLAAGLLMGRGAVAVADPVSGGSPNGDDGGTNLPVRGGTPSSPVGKITGTLPKTLQDVASTVGSGPPPGQQSSSVTSTVGSGRQPGEQSPSVTSTVGSDPYPGQQPSAGAKSPKIEPGGTGSGLIAAVPDPVAAVPDPVAAVPDPVEPVTDVVAPVTDVVAPVTDVVASVPDLVAPVTDVLTPASDVIASGQYMPTSVAGAVVSLTQAPSDLSSLLLSIAGVAPVTDVVAPVTDVLTPVSDVIAQYMPTSVADAVVSLTQAPSDLSSFLLGIAGVAPIEDGAGDIRRPGRAAAAGASGASPVPLGPQLAGIPGVPVAGNATRVETLDVTLLGRVSALSGMAPQAPNGAVPMGAESFFPHDFDELLLIASLWALAAVALPGIGGLVIVTVVGVRIGYGRVTPDSRREHRAFRDSPVPRAVKRWMSAR